MSLHSHTAQAPRLDAAAVRSAYARWVPIYGLLAAPTKLALRAAVQSVNRLEGTILEAGVGTGAALPLYGKHLDVVGVDLSHDMLLKARELVTEKGYRNVRALMEMDITAMAFGDGAFDGVVSMFTMTALPDPAKGMDELARVTRPGGSVIVVSHFQAQRAPWTLTDRILSPFGPKLGWNPSMPIEPLLGCPELELVERRDLPPLGLFTLLRFHRR